MKTRRSGSLVGGVTAVSLLLSLTALTPTESLAAGQGPAPAPTLAVGDMVPAFDAEALDGTTQHIYYPKGSTTVILFFLSSCPTCHRMIPEWNRVYASKPANLTVLGVMLDREPPGFFDGRPTSFPVVRALSRDLGRTFKIAHVPMTLRVAAGGKVEGVAVGATDPIRLGELFRR
jgi:thiol-disulfide isomerase/thioredoxin